MGLPLHLQAHSRWLWPWTATRNHSCHGCQEWSFCQLSLSSGASRESRSSSPSFELRSVRNRSICLASRFFSLHQEIWWSCWPRKGYAGIFHRMTADLELPWHSPCILVSSDVSSQPLQQLPQRRLLQLLLGITRLFFASHLRWPLQLLLWIYHHLWNLGQTGRSKGVFSTLEGSLWYGLFPLRSSYLLLELHLSSLY